MTDNPQGFTPEIAERCRKECAFYDEPPCWMLPELVEPCEIITPCDKCAALARLRKAMEAKDE